MNWTLIAAAGLAEAAWLLDRLLMYGGLFVIGLLATLAAAMASRKLAISALAAVALFCFSFRPWYCFAPFEAKAYDDPDVVYAAAEFRTVGFFWVAVCLFALVCVALAWSKASRRPAADAMKRK